MQSTSKLWVLASFYINQKYISENICINRFDAIPVCKGQCFLNEELKKKEQQDQKLPELNQKETTLYYQQNSLFKAPDLSCFALSAIPATDVLFHPSGFYTSIFHPPQLG